MEMAKDKLGDDGPYGVYKGMLRRSKTGQRLAELFPPPWHDDEILFANATEGVGNKSSSYVGPNPRHVNLMLDKRKAGIRDDGLRWLILCGTSAHSLLRKLNPELLPRRILLLPHPAYRQAGKLFWAAAKDFFHLWDAGPFDPVGANKHRTCFEVKPSGDGHAAISRMVITQEY